MSSFGYALLLAALVVGGGIVCNLLSKMADEQCAKECPENTAALDTKFEVGPFHLRMCNCGEVVK